MMYRPTQQSSIPNQFWYDIKNREQNCIINPIFIKFNIINYKIVDKIYHHNNWSAFSSFDNKLHWQKYIKNV